MKKFAFQLSYLVLTVVLVAPSFKSYIGDPGW